MPSTHWSFTKGTNGSEHGISTFGRRSSWTFDFTLWCKGVDRSIYLCYLPCCAPRSGGVAVNRDEYISSLVQKRERNGPVQLQPGDVVLVETEDKRVTWPLAIVEEVYPGADGMSRVVRVRTAAGTKVRPVQRIFPLELNSHDRLDSSFRLVDTDCTRQTQTETNDSSEVRSTRARRLPQHLFDYILD
ncbi:uncharacterized protein LOC133533004 [Cydia pomonella]|uniref:uncharacterized protein LOC133533004 n=1 Tax=Cydia pomonella TaxID=82600 RepID=UPI002ADD4809|nr:uncharacterized protein LOC133533004 [Cydia pomonella]